MSWIVATVRKVVVNKDGARVEFEAPISEAEKIVRLHDQLIEQSFTLRIAADEDISCYASFPGLSSDISIGNESVRFKLDIPESELSAILKFIAYCRNNEYEMRFEAPFME